MGGPKDGEKESKAGWLESFAELKYPDFTTFADLRIFQACLRVSEGCPNII